MSFNREFGQRLFALRKANKHVQKDLAEMLGVTPTHISDMENGRRATTLEKLAQICVFYNISADYLLGLTDEMRPLVQNQKKDVS